MAAPVAAAGSVADTRQESLSAGSLDSGVQPLLDSGVEIQHSESSEGTTRQNEFVSETLAFESSNRNYFEINPNEVLYVTNEDTGNQTTISLSGFSSTNVSTVIFSQVYNGTGELNPNPELTGIDEQGNQFTIDATVSDNVFNESTPFSEFSIRHEGNATSPTTGNRLVGIGYEGSIDEFYIEPDTEEINVSVPRASAVNESWYAEFTIGENSSSLLHKEVRTSVQNNAADDYFNFTVDVSNLTSGTYTSTLDLYETETDVDNRTASDRILSISAIDNIDVDSADVDGPTGDAVQYNADNVSVWSRSPLPLRVDTTNAETTLENPKLRFDVLGPSGGSGDLNKPKTGVFNEGDTISFNFSERSAAKTKQAYGGQPAQFVTARFEEEPNNTSEAIDIATLQSPTAEEYNVEDVGEINNDGSLDIEKSFNNSGHYLTYVVEVEEGDGLNATETGELSLDGSVNVIGMEAVTVQSGPATVSPPPTVQRGENITVDVTDSGLDSGAQNHLLIAYNESKFTQQTVTFISETDDFSSLSEDDLTINHTLDRVDGVGTFDANVSVLGLSADSTTRIEGPVSTDSIFAELTNQTSIDELENNSVGDNVLDASATSTATLDDGSISVETLAGWETGEYRLIYVAQEDGEVSNFTTTTTTTTLTDEELVADLTVEPTDPDVNVTEVTFDASGTQGTVVNYQWDFDGDDEIDRTTSSPTTSYSYSELGSFTPSVTVVNGDNEESTATASVTVGDTVSPTAVLDLPNVADGEIGIDRRFTANASGSSDNHRLASSYTWKITNSSGTVVDRETIDPRTSFRLSQSGTYTIELTVVDESGNENSTSTEIDVVDESILDARITTDNRQRLQDGLNATVNVSNVGSTATEGGYNYTLTATGEKFSGGEVTRTITNSSSSLGTSQTDTFEFDDELTAWAQENRTVGDVELSFNVSADGRTSNASTTVDVTYSNLEADARVRDTVEGVDVALRSFIENNGTAASDDTTATVTVENESGEVRNRTVAIGSLGPGETLRDRNTTSFDTAGEYTLNVSVENDVFDDDATSTTFEVYNYSLEIQNVNVPSDVESGEDFIAQVTYNANASVPVDAELNVSDYPNLNHMVAGQSDTIRRTPRANVNETVTWRLNSSGYNPDDFDLGFTVTETSENLDESDSQNRTVVSTPRSEIKRSSAGAAIQQGQSTSTAKLTVYGNDSTISGSHSINVSVQAGAQGRTLQGVEYLVEYPYGCVEQTTSAFLGALGTDQYYRDNENYTISTSQQQDINQSIRDGVARLGDGGERSQGEDGSWNMWGSTYADGETFYTMYALYGLSEVDNDEIYGLEYDSQLDRSDFNKTVIWMKDNAQKENGAFDGDDPGYYIGDDPGATGFAMVSLAAANESTRTNASTKQDITNIYVNASDYLIDAQLNGESDDSWADSERSTALAVWGLTQAYNAEVYNETSKFNQTQMETAIDQGAGYLEGTQDGDGSWSPYQTNPWWEATGDKSETTAYAVLALNETTATVNQSSVLVNATQNGTDYLTSTYESQGSWGYTRASSAAIKALTETTTTSINRQVNVKFENSSDSVSVQTDIELNNSAVDNSFSLNTTELDQVRDLLGDNEEGTVTVNVTETEASSGDGIVITGVENEQEVNLDELEASS